MTPEEFTQLVANLSLDGEPQDDGKEFSMTIDDAFETVSSLIDLARSIVAKRQGRLTMRAIAPFVINFILYLTASEIAERAVPDDIFLVGWIAGVGALYICNAFDAER